MTSFRSLTTQHTGHGTLLFLAILLAACGGAGDAAPATGGAPGTASTGGPGAATVTRGSVVLSANDIHTVAPGRIEEGIPISGNLRAAETVSVRARVEGDLVALHVREGDRVAAGDVMARLESTEQDAALRSAEADVVAARTEAGTAEWELEQTRDLHKAGAVAERELRAAEQAAVSAAARLAAAEARLRAAEAVARDTRILAPIAGVVERRSVENGERVARGAELFTVVRSDVLELTAAVPARRAQALAVGQTVRFSADGRQIAGRVARVSPTIDLASQSVTVYVEVPNRNGALRGNAFATGQIIEHALDGQLLVPQGAIRQSAATAGGGPFVWRIDGGTLASAPVRLGIVDEARGVVQVLEGLAAGDQVVVGNVGLLGVGMAVQVIGTESRGAR